VIGVRCPKCAEAFEVEDAMRGRTDRCPRCATPVPVPDELAAEAPTHPVLSYHDTIINHPLAATGNVQADLDHYLAALVEAVVARADLFAPTGPGAELYVSVTLKGTRKVDLSTHVDPPECMLDAAALARLFQTLLAVLVPIAGGPAQVTLVFAVRGGSGRAERPGG
jgi:hypothetical protein